MEDAASMIHARSLYHLIRADFLERVRRLSFLVVMGLTVYAGYAMVPSGDASYNAFVIGGQRGIYNSAWVGTIFGIVTSTLLTIIGFYLIRNAVNRDYETRVGQIIASTPIRKPVYLTGKWLSNLAVLSSILIVLTIMAVIMLLVRAEDPGLDLWALIMPIWLIGFPALAVVSSIAVLFETLPLLRSGIGQAVYFMLVCWYIAQPFLSSDTLTPFNDFAGVSRTLVDIRQLLESNGYDITQGTTDLFEPTGGRKTILFDWSGLKWSAAIVFERLLWFGLAAGLILVAVLPFDRFDPARRFRRRGKRKTRKEKRGRKKISGKQILPPTGEDRHICQPGTDVKLTPLDTPHAHRRFFTTVFTEFRLLAWGRQWWWYGVVLGASPDFNDQVSAVACGGSVESPLLLIGTVIDKGIFGLGRAQPVVIQFVIIVGLLEFRRFVRFVITTVVEARPVCLP